MAPISPGPSESESAAIGCCGAADDGWPLMTPRSTSVCYFGHTDSGKPAAVTRVLIEEGQRKSILMMSLRLLSAGGGL
jgi:hypothetical protein